MAKKYRLLASNGAIYESETPGELGGNSRDKLYGRLDCSAANNALAKGYASHRVFFSNEAAAIAAGFRPCARCLREQYTKWSEGGVPGSKDYPWLQLPKDKPKKQK